MQKPLREARTLLLTALCATLVVVVLYAALGVWPFGAQTVLTGDLNGQYISYNAHFARALRAGGDGLAYTFEKHMGGSMLGILAYYCASPLNLLYLFLPVTAYGKMAGLVLALKLVLACVAMAFFTGRHTPQLRHRAVLPGLCYGFCAYSVAYTQNIMWLDVLVLLPLVAYGIDVLCETKRSFVFAVWLGLAIFANFYIAYMACIFAVLYFVYELLRRGTRQWLRACGSFVFGALCAGGMTAVLLLPALADVRANKGLAAAVAFTGKASFKLTEFFYRLLPFNFIWEDAENGLPNVYCGALTLVLVLLYFCAKGIPRREKLLSLGMTAVLFLSLYSADFALAMHGFVRPVWFPYRHAFLFSFWLVLLASRALACAKPGLLSGAATACCGLSFLAVCFFVRNVWFTATLFGVGALLCAAYCAAIWGLRQSQSRRTRAVCLALCLALCVGELAANSYAVMNQFEKYPDDVFVAFTQEGTQAVAALQGFDDGVYRVEKPSARSLNDPLLLEYRGLSHFGSTQNSVVTDWCARLGFGNVNKYAGGSTAFAEALCSLRYVFAHAGEAVPAHDTQLSLKSDSTVFYENAYALPMAFLAPQGAAQTNLPAQFTPVQTFAVQNTVFAALSGLQTPLFTEIAVTATAGGKKTDTTGSFGAELTYKGKAPRDGLVYAVLESSEGRPVVAKTALGSQPYFAGGSNGVIQLGRCRAGEEFSLHLTAEWGLMDISAVRFAVLDETLLERFTTAAQETTAASMEMTSSRFACTARAEQPALLVLSIPYDENLSLTVDGVSTPVTPLFDALCAVPLAAGEHTVRVVYQTPLLVPGLLITLAALAMLILAWFALRQKEKKHVSVNYCRSRRQP